MMGVLPGGARLLHECYLYGVILNVYGQGFTILYSDGI